MRFSCLGLLHLQLMYSYETYVLRMNTAGMSTYLVLRIWDWGVTCFCGGPCRSSLSFRLHDCTERACNIGLEFRISSTCLTSFLDFKFRTLVRPP
ncbi:hypothetical protein M6B38_293025 [Iris pallida]|uniref:Secreted protein n=1 Tax=Iris pallida TaxID=29817 RepID=A0AAX6HW89_IRIPA|nr:hypothetical protein M6B38_293025 [Iris pallida]